MPLFNPPGSGAHPDLATHEALGLSTDTDLSDHTGEATDAHDASAISFTPNGSIAATDVQTAIVEVRDEAAGGGAPSTADFLVGTADGGLSNEIVVGATPGGELGGTWASPTVDATHAGTTHAAASDTHVADTSAAHVASSIGFTPDGSIAATDVQAAIQEVRDEAGGASSIGLPLVVTPPPYFGLPTAGTNSTANQAFAYPVFVPAPMKLRGLYIAVSTSAAGAIQWGLFDYSASLSAATKLAGGSAAPGGTGYRSIGATSAPVDIAPGSYMLVIKQPAATPPTLRTMIAPSPVTVPWNQSWTSYTWDDTPDFTSASWVAVASILMVYLEGDMDGSGTRWG